MSARGLSCLISHDADTYSSSIINLLAFSIELAIRAAELVVPSRVSLAKVEKYLEKRTGSFGAYDDLSHEELLALGIKSERIRKKKMEEQWHRLGFASSKEAEELLAARVDATAPKTSPQEDEGLRRGSEYRPRSTAKPI